MPSRLCPRSSLIVLPVAAALLSGCAQSGTAAPGPATTPGPTSATPEAPAATPATQLPAVPDEPPAAQSPAAEPPTAEASAAGSPAAPSPVAPVPARPADPLAPAPPLEAAPQLGAPGCRAGDLSVTHADSVYTPGTVQEVFVLRTTGADCQLTGYPTLRLLGADGSPLAVRVREGGAGLPARPTAPVALSRTTSVSFVLATSRAKPCADAASASVTLPGEPTPLRSAADLRVCGGSAAVSALGRLEDDETADH